MSEDIASIILRKFSAWRSSWLAKVILPIFVRPSTRKATSLPNPSRICLVVVSVSSTVSCRRPVMMVAASIFMSTRIPATSMGCVR